MSVKQKRQKERQLERQRAKRVALMRERRHRALEAIARKKRVEKRKAQSRAGKKAQETIRARVAVDKVYAENLRLKRQVAALKASKTRAKNRERKIIADYERKLREKDEKVVDRGGLNWGLDGRNKEDREVLRAWIETNDERWQWFRHMAIELGYTPRQARSLFFSPPARAALMGEVA